MCVCVPGQYLVGKPVGVELSGQSWFPELFEQPNQIMGIQLKRLAFKREKTHILHMLHTGCHTTTRIICADEDGNQEKLSCVVTQDQPKSVKE